MWGPFTKHCERIKKFRETDNLKHLYRNELNKACFAHEAVYSDSKDLVKITISDKVLKEKAYEIARNKKDRIKSDSDKQNGNECQ